MDIFLCSDPALGSVTEVVTAIAATLAALTGTYGVFNAVKSYKASIKDAEWRSANERRDQARYVHPLVLGYPSLIEEGSTYLHERAFQQVHPESGENHLRTKDASQEGQEFATQMLQVTVQLDNASDEVISGISLGLSSEDDIPELQEAGAGLTYLLPNQTHDINMVFPWEGSEEPDTRFWIATVVFTDARGNVWTRETGQPVQDFTGSH